MNPKLSISTGAVISALDGELTQSQHCEHDHLPIYRFGVQLPFGRTPWWQPIASPNLQFPPQQMQFSLYVRKLVIVNM